MAQFDFLAEFPAVQPMAERAAALALADPRSSCFHSRWVVEQLVNWAFENDSSLRLPYDTNVSALVNSPSFIDLAGDKPYKMAREIIRIGNRAVHDKSDPSRHDSVASVSSLFYFSYWFARTYSQTKPAPNLKFDPATLPDPRKLVSSTKQQIEELQAELEEEREQTRLARERIHGEDGLKQQVLELQAKVREAKKASEATGDEYDYDESDTRSYLIDLLLNEAGWIVKEQNKEVEVTGFPSASGIGKVDYVFYRGDGAPLFLVEAKRTSRDPIEGQQQAKLYADALEDEHGVRPVIFTSNGYEHRIWDDSQYPPRTVKGFYREDEIDALVKQRTSKESIVTTDIKEEIINRPYQIRALREIARTFEEENARKALLVMATGTGKTRTAVALSDVLDRANWARRVLFLADRKELVKQATKAYRTLLPHSSPINLVVEKKFDGDYFLSTYPTMLNLINKLDEHGQRSFGPGFFDLIIIDEAHRSVFKKYKAIFEYFDSLLVGLTATPRDEIDRNTYSILDLEDGVPTDVYELEEAVSQGYLVPPLSIRADLSFVNDGIVYDDLTDEEKEEFDELEWIDDNPPPHVTSDEVGSKLMNADTIDQSIQLLLAEGQYVDSGETLGKTIIFAKNQPHAKAIEDRFNVLLPKHKGKFARAITNSIEHTDSLIEEFGEVNSDLRVAISVDMLDTGIDVPEVLNLVFFKQVRSKTKFWQMLGRGTRLCEDVFGPGIDKEHFVVIDHGRNLEFFSQEMIDKQSGRAAPSLSEKVFASRIDLIDALDETESAPSLRASIIGLLREQVDSLDLNNIVVRDHRELIERLHEPAAWEDKIDPGLQTQLVRDIAPLPHGLSGDDANAKRFDLLLLSLQLGLLQNASGFGSLKNKLIGIAEQLQSKAAALNPKQNELVEELVGDVWWDNVDVDELETVRVTLRDTMRMLQPEKQKVLYANFKDELLTLEEVDFQDLGAASDFGRFRRKAQDYLREHLEEGAIKKVHTNQALTSDDVDELRSIFVSAGVGGPEDIDAAERQGGSFVNFIRSLVGMDRKAATKAFEGLLASENYRPEQQRFIDLMIDYIATNGSLDVEDIYEAPFTSLAPSGPEEIFEESQVDALVEALERFGDELAGGR